ncbi:MAG: hypothetical protein DVB25_03515 [Verrucomicrobia bacterium]|nr:MAG: hypothetical protein DVB25_03515 [Verrucomicrobiota bacterium]
MTDRQFRFGPANTHHTKGGVARNCCRRHNPTVRHRPREAALTCGRSRGCRGWNRSRGGGARCCRLDGCNPLEEMGFFRGGQGGVAAHFEKPGIVALLGNRTNETAVLEGVAPGGEALDIHGESVAEGRLDHLGLSCEGGLVQRRLAELVAPAVDVGERAANCPAQDRERNIRQGSALTFHVVTGQPHRRKHLLLPMRRRAIGKRRCRHHPGACRHQLLGAEAGIGISLGDECVVEAGLYITAGTLVRLPDGEVVKARELNGAGGLLYRRNSQTGAVEAIPRSVKWDGLNGDLHKN